MYNFKDIENIKGFLNEIGANIELTSNGSSIVMVNEFGETDTFLSFEELNKYANEQISALIENDLNQDILDELIEEFTF